MAEQQVNPKLTHKIASGNVDAEATEKKIEALELLDLTESTLIADVCRLSKLEYFTSYQVFKISKTFSLNFQEEFCTTQLEVYLPSYTLSCSG